MSLCYYILLKREGSYLNDLIDALQILLKYNPDNKYPTHCEHDVLQICDVDPKVVPL